MFCFDIYFACFGSLFLCLALPVGVVLIVLFDSEIEIYFGLINGFGCFRVAWVFASKYHAGKI